MKKISIGCNLKIVKEFWNKIKYVFLFYLIVNLVLSAWAFLSHVDKTIDFPSTGTKASKKEGIYVASLTSEEIRLDLGEITILVEEVWIEKYRKSIGGFSILPFYKIYSKVSDDRIVNLNAVVIKKDGMVGVTGPTIYFRESESGNWASLTNKSIFSIKLNEKQNRIVIFCERSIPGQANREVTKVLDTLIK